MGLSTVLCLLVLNGVLLSQQMSACEGLKIAAFNIRQLGLRKINDDSFTTPLTNVCAYDGQVVTITVIYTCVNDMNACLYIQ